MSEHFKHYISAFWETVIITILTLLPTLIICGSILLDTASGKTFEQTYNSGEFFLYGVSFTTSALIVYKHNKNKMWFALAVVLLSSILYAVTLSAAKPNIPLIGKFSFGILSISLIIFYFSQVTNNKNSVAIDVPQYRNEEVQDLSDGLN